MTLREAIDRADNEKPNQFTVDQKVEWLSQVDFNVFNDILTKHHPLPNEIFAGYTEDNLDDKLFADAPYDAMYVAYLKMKYDEMNEDTVRYNNSVILFNGHLDNYEKFYHRMHKPVKLSRFNIWGR